MKLHYFVPAMAVLILLGQGCLTPIENQGKSESPGVSENGADRTEDRRDEDGTEADSSDVTEPTGDEGADSAEAPPAVPPVPTKEYRGFYFDVRYPEGFTASPSGPTVDYSGQTVIQTDAAQFESPDGRVAFYVYSPLWSGEPDYLKVASNETLVDEKTTETDDGDTMTKWATIKANDGSYYRSYVSTRRQITIGSEVHHVFGIKYADQAAYDQYQDEYTRFKSSLTQYAD